MSRLSRSEVDELLRRADELVTTLRRATLELAALGNRLTAARARRTTRTSPSPRHRPKQLSTR